MKNDKKDEKNGDSSDGGNSDYSNEDDNKNLNIITTATNETDKNQTLLIEPPKKFKKKIITSVK